MKSHFFEYFTIEVKAGFLAMQWLTILSGRANALSVSKISRPGRIAIQYRVILFLHLCKVAFLTLHAYIPN